MVGIIKEVPIKYARDHKEYELLGVIGSTKGAIIYKAKYAPISSKNSVTEDHMVGIKVFNTCKVEDFYHLINEIHIAKQCCHHENIQGVYCSFKVESQLWVLMPLISRVTLKSSMLSCFPHDLPKSATTFVLKETLRAIDCIHGRGGVHGNVDADHIFLDNNLKIKLGFSSLTSRPKVLRENPSWMIDPDLIGHDQKSDIRMFGLLALYLFSGPCDDEAFESLGNDIIIDRPKYKLNVRQNSFWKLGFSCFGASMKKKLPKHLGDMVAQCLSIPVKQPSASELMNHKFFEGCSTSNRHLKKVLKKLYKEDNSN